ncbi:unnamed protein product [Rangifer tarandus platyrhynchus]|uniref:Uncharacterized protein n=1 Tax=Rangifer tarandus platyrhynchus TaxID=3082113 RepID=A0ABN8ZXJ8_RANTA|nr:unnamed protein product [Rangifer tarandus platyrhynchus]
MAASEACTMFPVTRAGEPKPRPTGCHGNSQAGSGGPAHLGWLRGFLGSDRPSVRLGVWGDVGVERLQWGAWARELGVQTQAELRWGLEVALLLAQG